MVNTERTIIAHTNRREFDLAKVKLFSEFNKGAQLRREQGTITLEQLKEKIRAKL